MIQEATIIKGIFHRHPAAIKFLTDATWAAEHCLLWNHAPFSPAEIEQEKLRIQRFYQTIPADQFYQILLDFRTHQPVQSFSGWQRLRRKRRIHKLHFLINTF